jgi:glutamyl-tRNA synthetase
MLRSRLAPTPSGYLHLGNAFSFLLTWLVVRKQHGHLHLRIDDLDADRAKPDYYDDIFTTLDWLGLDYDSGARMRARFLLVNVRAHCWRQ